VGVGGSPRPFLVPVNHHSCRNQLMKKLLFVLAAGLLLPCGIASADDDDDEFYKTKNCFACHRIDRNHLGPPFKAIAAKYVDDKGADAKLAKKIREGTVGAWGTVPMPEQAQVNDAEALKLARWILALK
jgi:cytochrome c